VALGVTILACGSYFVSNQHCIYQHLACQSFIQILIETNSILF
jgi:hypothetical protein